MLHVIEHELGSGVAAKLRQCGREKFEHHRAERASAGGERTLDRVVTHLPRKPSRCSGRYFPYASSSIMSAKRDQSTRSRLLRLRPYQYSEPRPTSSWPIFSSLEKICRRNDDPALTSSKFASCAFTTCRLGLARFRTIRRRTIGRVRVRRFGRVLLRAVI